MRTIKCYLAAALSAATFLTGCKYDDGDLWDKVNEHEDRLSTLEQ